MPSTLGIVASSRFDLWYDNFRAAYERAAAGDGQAHIVVVGDSVAQGFYGSTPYYQHSWPGRVSSVLATRTGVTPGTGVLPVLEEFEVTDARTSVTGTWSTFTGGFFGVGRSASSSATFVLGPVTCSAFRITYATESDGGAWTATIDSGTPTNLSSNGTAGVATIELDAGGVGSHTLTITATNKCYLVAVEAISNPTTGVKVSRIARSSQETSALIANADGKSSLESFRSLAADLVVIGFGLNEAYNSTTTATFEANLATLIDEAKAIGASVLVVASPPPNTTWISESTWSDFRTSMETVATTENVGFLDMADYWLSYATNSAYFSDNVHPSAAGHYDFGSIVAGYLLDIVDPVSSTFTPADLPSLALWLDASDASSFTYSSGDLVSQWNDKSGNTRHLTQAATTNQPSRTPTVYGRKVVSFDGVDNVMGGGDVLDLGTSDLTVYAVVKWNNVVPSSGQGRTILGKYKVSSSDGGWLLLLQNSGAGAKIDAILDAGSIAIASSAVYSTITPDVVGTIMDRVAGSITNRVALTTDGTTSFTPDSASSRNTAHGLWLGALRNSADSGFQGGYWLNAYVCEVVVCLAALGTTDRDELELYLARRWGIRL